MMISRKPCDSREIFSSHLEPIISHDRFFLCERDRRENDAVRIGDNFAFRTNA